MPTGRGPARGQTSRQAVRSSFCCPARRTPRLSQCSRIYSYKPSLGVRPWQVLQVANVLRTRWTQGFIARPVTICLNHGFSIQVPVAAPRGYARDYYTFMFLDLNGSVVCFLGKFDAFVRFRQMCTPVLAVVGFTFCVETHASWVSRAN